MSEKSSSEWSNKLPKDLPLRSRPTPEDWNKGIQNFTERIETATKNSQDEQLAYFFRGVIYEEISRPSTQYSADPNDRNKYFEQAIDDYAKSYETDSDIFSYQSSAYFAYQVSCIFQNENRVKAFKFFRDLLEDILNVKGELFQKPNGEIIHYTSQEACSALVLDKEPFRSYNTEGMDDINEGKAFFEVMKQLDFPDLESTFYRGTGNLSPAYATSFANNVNSQYMEDIYGPVRMNFKHGTDFSPIASKSLHKVVLPMLYVRGLPRYPETRPPLSRIFYVGDDKNSPGEFYLLMDFLRNLGTNLRWFRGFYEEFSKNSGIREPLIRLVQELLDEIRFLFKSNKWKDQKEVRALWMRYDQNSDDIKTDCEKGRKYIDALRKLSCTEVGLAPKVKNPDEYTEQLRQANPGLVVRKI